MSLCKYCSSIDFEAIYYGVDCEHMPDATKLLASACDLCALMRATILQHEFVTIEERAAYWQPRPIVLRRQEAYIDRGDGFRNENERLPLDNLEISIPVVDGEDVVRLGICAENSTDTGTQIISERRMIENSGSDVAFTRLQSWIADCNENHARCNEREAVNFLPTRLLLISNQEQQSCRLVHTTGIDVVEYAALSHCWGEYPILTTTTANIAKHLDAILVDDLPRTFREAIQVARRLGISYIWIDSLCIVQDDKEDWKREAATMGDVYSGSKITIAATGADDGTKGLFMERPPLAPPVVIPYKNDFVTLYQHPSEQYGSIDNSPLDERAWITQEWLLSAKVIHYARACMIWSCCTITESEDGERQYSLEKESLRGMLGSSPLGYAMFNDQDFFEDWSDIVRSYCSRKLKYDSDKPVAIQGLANKLAATRTLTYRLGVFMQDDRRLTDTSQLLWFSKPAGTGYIALSTYEMAESGLRRPQVLSDIPSWSWQSTIGHIAFHVAAREAETIAQDVRLEAGFLVMTSRLIPVQPSFGPVSVLRHNDKWPMHKFFSKATFSQDGIVFPHGLHYLGSPEEPRGWISFDEAVKPMGTIYACAISQNKSEGTNRDDGINVLVLQVSARGDGSYVRVGAGEVLDSRAMVAHTSREVIIR